MRRLLGAPHRRPPLRLRGLRSWAGVLRLRMDRVGRRRRPARVRGALFAGTASVFHAIITTPERAGLGAASACPTRPSPSKFGPSTVYALLLLKNLPEDCSVRFHFFFLLRTGCLFIVSYGARVLSFRRLETVSDYGVPVIVTRSSMLLDIRYWCCTAVHFALRWDTFPIPCLWRRPSL